MVVIRLGYGYIKAPILELENYFHLERLHLFLGGIFLTCFFSSKCQRNFALPCSSGESGSVIGTRSLTIFNLMLTAVTLRDCSESVVRLLSRLIYLRTRSHCSRGESPLIFLSDSHGCILYLLLLVSYLLSAWHFKVIPFRCYWFIYIFAMNL